MVKWFCSQFLKFLTDEVYRLYRNFSSHGLRSDGQQKLRIGMTTAAQKECDVLNEIRDTVRI